MEALKTVLIGVLRTNYNVAVEVIAFVIRTMQLNLRFLSPLSPSEFNKVLTEICINAPDNGREMAKMIVSLVVQTSVSSQKDGLMVVNNDKELVDRFMDSLYTDSSSKDDITLVKKTKVQVVSILKQGNNMTQDSQDDEEQQYNDDEFEPESPNRLNMSTGNTLILHLFNSLTSSLTHTQIMKSANTWIYTAMSLMTRTIYRMTLRKTSKRKKITTMKRKKILIDYCLKPPISCEIH